MPYVPILRFATTPGGVSFPALAPRRGRERPGAPSGDPPESQPTLITAVGLLTATLSPFAYLSLVAAAVPGPLPSPPARPKRFC